MAGLPETRNNGAEWSCSDWSLGETRVLWSNKLYRVVTSPAMSLNRFLVLFDKEEDFPFSHSALHAFCLFHVNNSVLVLFCYHRNEVRRGQWMWLCHQHSCLPSSCLSSCVYRSVSV